MLLENLRKVVLVEINKGNEAWMETKNPRSIAKWA